MSARRTRVALALGLCLAIAASRRAALAAPAPDPAILERVAVLEREVEEHPDDVDRRLQLATALASSDRRADARREALRVLALAPHYLDAHVVLARLDAWDRRWRDAHAHLDHVLAAAPTHLEARVLALDVSMWSGELGDARRALATIRASEIGEAELLYRHAQLALAEREHRRVLALVRRILTLDPRHVGARSLRDAVHRYGLESATDAEIYPAGYRERLAIGETLAMTLFPRARWSPTAVYEYRRRYGTDNHRGALRVDWRPNDRWTVIAFVRGGRVEVVPRLTAFGEASWARAGWMLGARYTYDRMPWPGDLHRAQVSAAAPVSRHVQLEGSLAIGSLRGCATSAGVWSARTRLVWNRHRWSVSGAYGYGIEADRAFMGTDPCAGSLRDLVGHDVQAGGLAVARTLGKRSELRVDYGLELRGATTRVQLTTLAVRTWL